MIIKWITSAFLGIGLVSCGGGSSSGSGVDEAKTLAELSDGELADICEYRVGLEQSPQREVDCGDGQTITVGLDAEDVQGAIDECVSFMPPATCTATVGEVETCFETIAGFTDDELCDFFLGQTAPAACEPIFDVSCTG
jgi:hypothetical protein